GADEVAIFASASETFSQKNINCSIQESIERFKAVAKAALTAGKTIRGYVSCIVGCPYEGGISPNTVERVTHELLRLGCYEVSLGDTIGIAKPDQISNVLDHLLRHIPAAKLAGHFHDTGNQALLNVEASLRYGLRTFDSAVGGLGGCPYAPGAKGNVSTMSLVEMLEKAGWSTGIDIDRLRTAETFLHKEIGGFSTR
ncbi:MAG: hydroxymethylglutaryl-CoA lyase, partial [Hyphomicrobiales bacterium]